MSLSADIHLNVLGNSVIVGIFERKLDSNRHLMTYSPSARLGHGGQALEEQAAAQFTHGKNSPGR